MLEIPISFATLSLHTIYSLPERRIEQDACRGYCRALLATFRVCVPRMRTPQAGLAEIDEVGHDEDGSALSSQSSKR